jgi:TolB-like protein
MLHQAENSADNYWQTSSCDTTQRRRKPMPITGSRMKPIRSILIGIMVVYCCQTAMAGVAPQVNTDKDIYHSGEKIRVNFFNSPGDQRDWICIVAAGSPDNEAGDYQYMPRGLDQGVLTFESPSPGKYEVRAYYNYRRNGYVVSARYGFSVVGGASSVASEMAPTANPRTDIEKVIPVERPVITAIPGNYPRVSVAVFHFTPLNMDASNYCSKATSTLINVPKMQSSFVMLDKKDLETFLVANDLQQNDQTENVINIGTKIGLNFVIAGNIEKRGTMIVTNSKVISIEKRKVVFTNRSISMGEADLIGNIMKMSDAMIEAILRSIP